LIITALSWRPARRRGGRAVAQAPAHYPHQDHQARHGHPSSATCPAPPFTRWAPGSAVGDLSR